MIKKSIIAAAVFLMAFMGDYELVEALTCSGPYSYDPWTGGGRNNYANGCRSQPNGCGNCWCPPDPPPPPPPPPPPCDSCSWIDSYGTWSVCDNGIQYGSNPHYSSYSCGGCPGSVSNVRSCPLPTLSLGASPATLSYLGGNSNINWSAANVATCSASNSWSGSKPLSGSETRFFPANNTTNPVSMSFSMECWNLAHNSSGMRTATVTVLPPPAPMLTFTASPSSFAYTGGTSILTWSASNAVSCVASGDWSGSVAVSGNSPQIMAVNNTPNPINKTFTLECRNSANVSTGPISRIVTVSPPPVPSLILTTDKKSLPINGGLVDVMWTPTDATSCTASNVGGWFGPKDATNGLHHSIPKINITSTSTFMLSCVNSAGVSTGTKQATVCVQTGCASNTCIGKTCSDCDDSGNPSTEQGTKDCRNENWQEVSPN